MKVVERNVMRLVAVQQLRAAYGIKVKNWNHKTKQSGANVCKSTSSNRTVKVFGVHLESLPQYNIKHGGVPRFLVDACMMLVAHIDTEGLFRKSGSVVRLKALRAKLDAGEECLSTAVPCDVAGLVKQFFRELPEPVLPVELHEAFLKAQQLSTEADRTAATLLLSCVLPDRNLGVLRYFFDFLHNVSTRSAENKMDSSNLSLILAPNLLHSGEGSDKMNANTEKRLKLQAAVIHCFIENARDFGVLPAFLMEKVPAMLGSEAGVLSPPHDGPEELDSNSGMKRRRRRSLGVFSSATPVIATPNSKRKQTLETGQSFGFSNKKRKSIKKNLGIDLLPNTLFSGTSTPRSVCGGSSEVLDSSHNTMSSVGKSSRQSARRKSRRLSNRHAVSRVESGKAGCFSPKVNKKEAPRKSLRSRFSLGKSSKEAGAESIGWRLATQESTTSFRPTKDFSPVLLPKGSESKSSKYFSKSEDNLLTPQCDMSALRTSWSAETPDGVQVFGGGSFTDTPMTRGLKINYYSSEPAIITASKPPSGVSLPKTLCCASSAESLDREVPIPETHSQSGPTLLQIKTTLAEAASDLRSVAQERDGSHCWGNFTEPSESVLMPPPETPIRQVQSIDTETYAVPTQHRQLAYDQNITFGQIEIAQLSPLHIDSALFDIGTFCTPIKNADESSLCTAAAVVSSHNDTNPVARQTRDDMENVNNSSRLIDALDIQSPAHFNLAISAVGAQSTPCRPGPELADELSSTPPKRSATSRSDVDLSTVVSARAPEEEQPPESQQGSLKNTQRLRVLDHVQRFNQLTIYSPKGSKGRNVRSPLKFQRTPVRQSVRRINSLLGDSRKPSGLRSPVTKSVSMESGLSSGARLQPVAPPSRTDTVQVLKKKPPPVPPKKPSTLARRPRVTQSTRPCALGDMTNTVQQQSSVPPADKKLSAEALGRQVAEKDACHYRGSPRNPLNQTRLLSATKPIDL